MNRVASSDQDLPEILIGQGWRQGALFHAPGLYVYQTDIDDPAAHVPSYVVRPIESQPDDRFVVVTQTCDIKAALIDEPMIEALLCRIVPDRNWRATITKSSRFFEVDREKGLIAYAARRTQISKKALVSFAPQPWPDTPLRLRRFSDWLGHRFSRPAIPDEVVEGFQQPAGNVLDQFRKKRAAEFLAFHQAVGQIRVGIDEHPTPPYDVRVVLLSYLQTLSKPQASAIETVMEEIEGKANPALVRLNPYRLLTPDKMSLAEYLGTKPLYFDYFTYRGDKVVGAEPPTPG